MKYLKFEELDNIQQELLNAAEESMKTHLFVDHDSGDYIGAALLTDKHDIVSALKLEDSASGKRCPEGIALVKANSMGYREYISIAYISESLSDEGEIREPCKDCRQMMEGYAGPDLEVILSTAKKDRIVVTSIDKLP